MGMFIRHFAIAMLLTVVTSSVGFAWSYYVEPETVALQDESGGTETFSAGTVISLLPDGARSITIERTQYFISGGNWFLPIAQEGVKYLVVLAPV
jgi:hypothetical protein